MRIMRVLAGAVALILGATPVYAGGITGGGAGTPGPAGPIVNPTTTTLGGVKISPLVVPGTGGAVTMGYLGGLDTPAGVDTSTANVTPLYNTTLVPVATAVSHGEIRIEASAGATSAPSGHTLKCAITSTAGSPNVTVPCASFAAGDVGKLISIDLAGAVPTTGPINTLPMTSAGSYPQGATNITLTRTDGGAGSGLVATPVWSVLTATVAASSGVCSNGLITLQSTQGGSRPVYATTTIANGAPPSIGTTLTIIQNPYTMLPATTGYFYENLPTSLVQTFGMIGGGPACFIAVTYTFGVDHWKINYPGAGYPTTAAYSVTGGSPTTAPVVGTPTFNFVPPPLMTSIASVTDATHVTLANNVGHATGATSVDVWYFFDDAPSIAAAVNQANARAALGQYSHVSLPEGRNLFVASTIPPFTKAGGIAGQGVGHSNILVDPRFSGDVASCLNTTRLVSQAWGGNTTNTDASATGCSIHGFTVNGWLNSPNIQNAFVARGGNDFGEIYNVSATNINGSCIALGLAGPGYPNAWWNESTNVADWRCRSTGAPGHPSLEITSAGTGQSSNTDSFERGWIFNPRWVAVALHDETPNTNGGVSQIHIKTVRVEAGVGMVNDQQSGVAIQDLIEIGSLDGVTAEQGHEGDISFDDMLMISTPVDSAGFKIMAKAGAGFVDVPHQILINNVCTGGGLYGSLFDIEAGRNVILGAQCGNPSNLAFDAVLGHESNNGSTTNLITEVRLDTERTPFNGGTYLYSIPPETASTFDTYTRSYCDPSFPATCATQIGQFLAYGGTIDGAPGTTRSLLFTTGGNSRIGVGATLDAELPPIQLVSGAASTSSTTLNVTGAATAGVVAGQTVGTLAGGGIAGNPTVVSATNASVVISNAVSVPAGTTIFFNTNQGSNFAVARFDDLGRPMPNPMGCTRSSGVCAFGYGATVPNLATGDNGVDVPNTAWVRGYVVPTAGGGTSLVSPSGYVLFNGAGAPTTSNTIPASSVVNTTGTQSANGATLGVATVIASTMAAVTGGTGGIKPSTTQPVGVCIIVLDNTASAINVYPDVGADTINNLAAGVAKSLPAYGTATICRLTASAFIVSVGS